MLALAEGTCVGHPREEMVNLFVEGHRWGWAAPSTLAITHRRPRWFVAPERIVQYCLRCCSNWLVIAPSIVQCLKRQVGAHGQSVDQQSALRCLEQFDGQHTDDAELMSEPQPSP
jgi:hypothetical protein